MIQRSVMTTKKRSFYLNMNYSKVNRQCWSNQARGYKASINKNPLLLCIGVQTQRQRATCFTPLNQSWRNQSSKANKEEKKALKASDLNLWFNLLWQLCTHQWQRLSLFPLLILHSHFSLPVSLFLSGSLSLFLSPFFSPRFLTLSSRSSPLLAPAQNEPPLHSGTLFLWQCTQAKQVSRIL